MIQTVGVIGYGHFGAFLVTLLERFAPEIEVRVYSRRQEPGRDLFTTLEQAAVCDVVILCGAMREYEEQLLAVLPHTREETILVDVATVKQYPTETFQKYAGERRWISTHPMFGPESYKKHHEDVSGFRIVITDYTLPNDLFLQLKNLLASLGFVVIEMSATEHDRLLAETLFVTHLIGQTIKQAGIERTTIDTVSFSYLMDAVESVINDRKLFEDVYRFNPYCKEVVDRLATAEEQVLGDIKG